MINPKLAVDKFYVDPANAHIVLRDDPDPDLFAILQRMCPASLYRHDASGYHYDYTGCLECGTCLILAGENVFALWQYPSGGFGVDYGEEA